MKVFEVVLKGHPDKVCDIIAESIKDMFGEGVRTAVEVVWFNNEVIVGGEVSCYFNNKEVKKLVRKILRDLGYDIKKIKIRIKLHSQSQEISNVVGSDGAGDNGVFYAGYHKLWTPKINELKELADRLSNVALLFGYKTDGKFIAVYEEDGTPIKFTLNIASNKEKVERHYIGVRYCVCIFRNYDMVDKKLKGEEQKREKKDALKRIRGLLNDSTLKLSFLNRIFYRCFSEIPMFFVMVFRMRNRWKG